MPPPIYMKVSLFFPLIKNTCPDVKKGSFLPVRLLCMRNNYAFPYELLYRSSQLIYMNMEHRQTL